MLIRRCGKLSKRNLHRMFRFQFLPWVNRVTIRTFSKEEYILKTGLILLNAETGEMKKIHDIYYDIRTVRQIDGTIVAKRKNQNSELLLQQSNLLKHTL